MMSTADANFSSFLLGAVLGFIFGAGAGYSVCRRLLHQLTLNEAGPEKTARIFGYPLKKEPGQ